MHPPASQKRTLSLVVLFFFFSFRAAVIHYNGNMKPWLEISMTKFKDYWSKYVDYGNHFLQACNING